MYELMILSLLIRRPSHGYLIAKIINDIIGPFAKVSNGRLYPLLNKLQQAGLIEVSEEADNEGGRQVRVFKITDYGRERFHKIMMDTASNPGEYQQIFHQKVSVLGFLKPEERLHLIDHYINYCQTHIFHLKAEGDDLLQKKQGEKAGIDASLIDAIMLVMYHRTDQWQLELTWAKKLREQEFI